MQSITPSTGEYLEELNLSYIPDGNIHGTIVYIVYCLFNGTNTVWQFLKESKVNLPYDSAILIKYLTQKKRNHLFKQGLVYNVCSSFLSVRIWRKISTDK